MKLAEWFSVRNPDGSKRRKGEFAEKIGKSAATVTAYLKGEAWPDRVTMAAITRETAGAVTANDFVELETAP